MALRARLVTHKVLHSHGLGHHDRHPQAERHLQGHESPRKDFINFLKAAASSYKAQNNIIPPMWPPLTPSRTLKKPLHALYTILGSLLRPLKTFQKPSKGLLEAFIQLFKGYLSGLKKPLKPFFKGGLGDVSRQASLSL
jgi:hypothetical protein